MSILNKYYQHVHTDVAAGFQFFSVCRQGVTFVIAIVLAKSSLSLEEIGIYEIWMYLGMILSFLGLSGFFQAFLALYPGRKPDDRKQIVFTTFLCIWLVTGFLVLLIYSFKKSFFSFFLGVEEISNLPLVLVFLLLHLNAIFASYIFLAEGRQRIFIPYSFFFAIGSVLAVLLPLIFSNELAHLLQSLLVWSILEQLFLLVVIGRNATFKINYAFIRALIIAAVPLTIYAGSGLLAQIFDAWLVTSTFQDLSVFALFKYGAREVPGAIALAAAFNASMIGLYVADRNKSLQRIKMGSQRFMNFFLPFSVLLLFVSKPVFGWIYNDAFRESAAIFNTYLLLMISRWVFPQAVLIGLGKNRALLWISLAELFINIIASLILVQFLGLIGIALGTVIAFFSEKIMMVMILKIKFQISLHEYIPVKNYLTYSSLLVIAYIVSWII